MGGKRILTDAQLDQMAAWREAGWSCPRIARRFTELGTPISASAISRQCMVVGADSPGCAPGPVARLADRTYQRGSFKVRTYTLAEDQELLALEAEGLNYYEIGRRLGRAPNSIRGRLLTLARHQARAERAA